MLRRLGRNNVGVRVGSRLPEPPGPFTVPRKFNQTGLSTVRLFVADLNSRSRQAPKPATKNNVNELGSGTDTITRLSAATYVGVLMPNGPTSDEVKPNSKRVVSAPRPVRSTVVHCDTM